MTVSEKNGVKQSSIQFRQANCSSGNVSKYGCLTGKDVLPEKRLLEKAAKMERFE